MTRYVITVTEVGQEQRTAGHEWKLGAGKDSQSFGYTREIERTCDYTRTIYTQLIDDLDLKAVIAAVNGVKG